MSSAYLPRNVHSPENIELSLLFEKLERQVVMDPHDALVIAADAADVVDFVASTAERMRFRRLRAMALANTSRFEAALECCLEAEAIDGSQLEPIELARVQLASMQPLANLDRAQEAIDFGKRAVDVLLNAGEQDLAGRGALNIGSILAMTGRPAESLEYFEMAKQSLQTDQTILGQIEINRGTALASLDRFTDAEEAFQRASTLLNMEEVSWAAAVAEENLAYLASRQGRINEGLRHFELARRLFGREDTLADLGRLEAEEAALLSAANLTTEAEAIFLRAIDLLRQFGTPGELAAAEIAYCDVLIEDGRVESATELLQEASARFDVSSNLHILEHVLELNTRIALWMGELDSAEASIDRGLAQTADRPIQGIRWLLLKADLAMARRQNVVARTTLEQALAESETAHITPFAGETHQRVAELERVEGNVEAANDHARSAILAFEKVRGTIQADQLRLSYHHRRAKVYEDLYRSLATETSQSAQAEAVTVIEQIRNRKMLDTLSHVNARNGRSINDEANETLANTLDANQRWINWMYSALADGLEPTSDQLTELEIREGEVTRIAGRLAILESGIPFWEPIQVEEFQKELSAGEAVLTFVELGGSVSAHVITGDWIRSLPDFVDHFQIGERVAEVQFQVGRTLAHHAQGNEPSRARRLQRDIDQSLEELHSLIFQPVERWLAGIQRLHIVSAGDLRMVPFSALRNNDRYLIDRFCINTVPSISILSRLTSKTLSVRTKSDVLVVGVPDDVAPGLGPEAISVANRFPGSSLLLGSDAIKAQVVEAMQSAGTIHLACHGRFDRLHPGASGLKLSDGWLTLNEIMHLQLNKPLVVLTGCETGRARIEQGDDPVGIAAALVTAGAQAVLTSLWKAHDGATQDMIENFYGAVDSDSDLSQALRTAQLKVREKYAHPAFWASFCCLEGMPKGEVG